MHFSFRAATCWLLLSMLSGALPGICAGANAATQSAAATNGGRAIANQDPVASGTPDSVASPTVQEPAVQVPVPSAPARHHSWKWIALIGVVAVGAGAAIISTNRQSGHTAATIPGATVGAGGGSVGPPH